MIEHASVCVRGLPAPQRKLEESRSLVRRLGVGGIGGDQFAHAAVRLVDEHREGRQVAEVVAVEIAPLVVGVSERLLEAGRVKRPAGVGFVGPDGGCQAAAADTFDGF